MQDPVDDPRNYKWNTFYFNKNDPRIMVPKRWRFMGWSMNFAHAETYLILLLFLTACFLLPFVL